MSFSRLVNLYWCHEEPITIIIDSIAKINGFYPILGIKGLLEYSRRELSEAKIHLPKNLIQGKGTVNVVFVNNEYLVIGATATITYVFIDYMGYPPKTKIYYTKTVFGDPNTIMKSYDTLKDLGLRLPVRVVGKMYKSVLFLTRYSRTQSLFKDRKIILWSILPFYIDDNTIVYAETSLRSLAEHLTREHNINVDDIGVIVFVPDKLDTSLPKKLVFKCKSACILGREFTANELSKMIGNLKTCGMCRYYELCLRKLMSLKI